MFVDVHLSLFMYLKQLFIIIIDIHNTARTQLLMHSNMFIYLLQVET